MDFFFYGTLMDADVRAAVLGREVASSSVAPATLSGYRRVFVDGQAYPVLLPKAGGLLDGLFVRGLGGRDAALIDHFEGHQYYRQSIKIELKGGARAEALVYLPHGNVPVTDIDWAFDDWCRRHRLDYLRQIAGWMKGSGMHRGDDTP